MSIKMRSPGRALYAGLALIVLTNGVALTGVYLNRSAAEARAALSERELALPYRSFAPYRDAENSGLALQLVWRVLDQAGEDTDTGYSSYGVRPAWLTAELMAALGFDTAAGAATPQARRHFTRQLPRPVLLVFEYEGPAWRAALARARATAQRRSAAAAANPGSKEYLQQAKAARDAVLVEEARSSRLFVIDAGVDAMALRARYPDRKQHLILAGRVRPTIVGPENEPRLSGFVSEVAIDEINVPFRLRPAFEVLRHTQRPAPEQDSPRYQVELAIGQRLEPWIVSVAALPAAALRP